MLEDIRSREDGDRNTSSIEQNHSDESPGMGGFDGMNYEQIRQPFLPQHAGRHPGEQEGSRNQESSRD